MSTEKCQQTDKMLKVDEVALVDSFEGLELVVKQAESSCPSFQKMLQAHNIIGWVLVLQRKVIFRICFMQNAYMHAS